MKERKEYQIKFRLTASLKEQIEEYCAAHGYNVSEFIRIACAEMINKGEEKK